MKKNKKLILIILLILVIIIVCAILFFNNYDIKVINAPSNEYNELLEKTSIEFYSNNHLLVREGGNYYIEANSKNLDNKYVNNTAYKMDDDGYIAKISECYDNKNNISYRWFRYKNKQYIQYNNQENKLYELYNFAKIINEEENNNVPNLKNFVSYKPQFVAKYKNVDEQDDNVYIEEYELYLKKDDFYKRELEKHFGNRKKAYLRVEKNNMNLVTAIGLSYEMASEYIYGPFIYEYYYDKNYDLANLYAKANEELSDDVITITFVNANDEKEIDKMTINKNDTLFIEKGIDIEGVYLDKGCKESYDDWLNMKIVNDNLENIIKNDRTVYVKEKKNENNY